MAPFAPCHFLGVFGTESHNPSVSGHAYSIWRGLHTQMLNLTVAGSQSVSFEHAHAKPELFPTYLGRFGQRVTGKSFERKYLSPTTVKFPVSRKRSSFLSSSSEVSPESIPLVAPLPASGTAVVSDRHASRGCPSPNDPTPKKSDPRGATVGSYPGGVSAPPPPIFRKARGFGRFVS